MKVASFIVATALAATAHAGSFHVRVHVAEPADFDGVALLDDQCAFPDGTQVPCDEGLVCMIGEDDNGFCMFDLGDEDILERKHAKQDDGPAIFGEQCAFPDGSELPCAEDLECYVDDEGVGICDFPLFDAKRKHKAGESYSKAGEQCFKNGGALLCEPGTSCLIDKQKNVGWCVPGDAKGGNCYKQCGNGEYCAKGSDKCFKPKETICLNPATGLFQIGCDRGFACKNGKCDYAKKHHHRRHHKQDDDVAIFGEQCAFPDGSELPCAEDLECYVDDEGFGVCDFPLFDTKRERKEKQHVLSSVKIDGQCFKDGGMLLCEDGSECLIDQDKQIGWCVPGKAGGSDCFKGCGDGEYCAKGSNMCYRPKNSVCMNPATGLFQIGCAPGFACKNGKCDYARKHHRHHRHHKQDDGVAIFGEQCAFPDGIELPCDEDLECLVDDGGVGICDFPIFDAKRKHTTKQDEGAAILGEQCAFPDGSALPCAEDLECYIDDEGFGICDFSLFATKKHHHRRHRKQDDGAAIFGEQCAFPDGSALPCAEDLECYVDDEGFGICDFPLFEAKHKRRHHKTSVPRASVDEQCHFEDGRKAQCEDNHMCIVDKQKNTGYCVPGNPNGSICYIQCQQEGTYCAKGTDRCYEPWGSTCLNPATGLFQAGCDPGFKCENFKCVFA